MVTHDILHLKTFWYRKVEKCMLVNVISLTMILVYTLLFIIPNKEKRIKCMEIITKTNVINIDPSVADV